MKFIKATERLPLDAEDYFLWINMGDVYMKGVGGYSVERNAFKNEILGCYHPIEKIEWLDEDAPDTEELEKILEWGCRQGYDAEPGIEYKIEIMGKVYTIPEAVELYLKSMQP